MVRVIPGIKEKLKQFKDAGHQIIWLTAPWKQSQTWCYDRTIWIERHFGDISKNVIYASHKEDVPGDILIDDNPENLRKWKTAHPDGEAILFRQPWNVFESMSFISGWDDSKLDTYIVMAMGKRWNNK